MSVLLLSFQKFDSLVRELTYTARPFSATKAEKLGLVSKVVEGGRDEVIQQALDLAKLIANKSPVAVASSKHHILTHEITVWQKT
jgi:delta(3,5)-delta(2,4)-dienoyl-CoA isomerase